MSHIIAARFETQDAANHALEELHRVGFAVDEAFTFYLTPPGQHGELPLGGDAHHDEGTKHAGGKAAAGAAIGGAAGLAIGVVAGALAAPPALAAGGALAGAGVGAYGSALAGALKGSRGGEQEKASEEEPVERPAGMMVAACVDREGMEDAAIRALRGAGAEQVERAQGEWRDGQWTNFDPTKPPEFV